MNIFGCWERRFLKVLNYLGISCNRKLGRGARCIEGENGPLKLRVQYVTAARQNALRIRVGTNFHLVNGRYHFSERSLPFKTVDAISKSSRTDDSLREKLVRGSLVILLRSHVTFGVSVLFTRWWNNPRAWEVSQLNQNQPILLVLTQNQNQ